MYPSSQEVSKIATMPFESFKIDQIIPQTIFLQIAIVGDCFIGKSAMIQAFLKNEFEDNIEQTVLDIYQGQVKMQDKVVKLTLVDTSGDDVNWSKAQKEFVTSNFFMVCFGKDNRDSLTNVHKWVTRIRNTIPEAMIMLVRTKSDIDDNQNTISEEEMKMFKKKKSVPHSG